MNTFGIQFVIQKLHSLGLLSGSFLPDETTGILRTYCRQRANWIDLASSASHKCINI